MSVCAVMLVKDEADIIGFTLEHLLTQVDEVILSDNMSTDGTPEIAARYPGVRVLHDNEVGYWQEKKTTQLAQMALQLGHQWVVPCDADEFWYANGRTVRELLGGLAPDLQIVNAPLYNHIPTAKDEPSEPNPIKRIGWRQREHGAMGKVACRLRPDLVIEPGNHSARVEGAMGPVSGGLIIRHFSWRTAAQYVRKIRNGSAAYRATDLRSTIGTHWRMWDEQPDEALSDHFKRWFWTESPEADPTLIFDPAPWGVT